MFFFLCLAINCLFLEREKNDAIDHDAISHRLREEVVSLVFSETTLLVGVTIILDFAFSGVHIFIVS